MGIYGLIIPKNPGREHHKYHGFPLLGVHPSVPWLGFPGAIYLSGSTTSSETFHGCWCSGGTVTCMALGTWGANKTGTRFWNGQLLVGGGNSNVYCFHSPRKLRKLNPIWRSYFPDGLVQPPTRTCWVSNLMFGTILTIFCIQKLGVQLFLTCCMVGWSVVVLAGSCPISRKHHLISCQLFFCMNKNESQKAYHQIWGYLRVYVCFFQCFSNHLKPIKVFEGRSYIYIYIQTDLHDIHR